MQICIQKFANLFNHHKYIFSDYLATTVTYYCGCFLYIYGIYLRVCLLIYSRTHLLIYKLIYNMYLFRNKVINCKDGNLTSIIPYIIYYAISFSEMRYLLHIDIPLLTTNIDLF